MQGKGKLYGQIPEKGNGIIRVEISFTFCAMLNHPLTHGDDRPWSAPAKIHKTKNPPGKPGGLRYTRILIPILILCINIFHSITVL